MVEGISSSAPTKTVTPHRAGSNPNTADHSPTPFCRPRSHLQRISRSQIRPLLLFSSYISLVSEQPEVVEDARKCAIIPNLSLKTRIFSTRSRNSNRSIIENSCIMQPKWKKTLYPQYLLLDSIKSATTSTTRSTNDCFICSWQIKRNCNLLQRLLAHFKPRDLSDAFTNVEHLSCPTMRDCTATCEFLECCTT